MTSSLAFSTAGGWCVCLGFRKESPHPPTKGPPIIGIVFDTFSFPFYSLLKACAYPPSFLPLQLLCHGSIYDLKLGDGSH